MDPNAAERPEPDDFRVSIIRCIKLVILTNVVLQLHPTTGARPDTFGFEVSKIPYLLRIGIFTTILVYLASRARQLAADYRRIFVDDRQSGDEDQPSPSPQQSTSSADFEEIQHGDVSQSWAIPPQSTLSTIPEETHHGNEADPSTNPEQSTPSEPRQPDRSDSIVENERAETPPTDESEVVEFQARHVPRIRRGWKFPLTRSQTQAPPEEVGENEPLGMMHDTVS